MGPSDMKLNFRDEVFEQLQYLKISSSIVILTGD